MLYSSATIPQGPDSFFEHDTFYPPLFRCPGWPEERPKPFNPQGNGRITFRMNNGKIAVQLLNPVKTVGVYGYNDCGHQMRFSFDYGFGLGDRCKEWEVATPSDMFAIGCAKTWATDRPIHPVEEGSRPVGWHSGRANMLFVDGHVELIKSNAIVALNETARRRWNRDNQPHREMW